MSSTGFDELVGKKIRAIRRGADVTQAELADALRERGLHFTQQVVAKVELGTRPIRLEEGLVIADVLHVPITALGVPISALIATGAGADVAPAIVIELSDRIKRLEAELDRLASQRVQPSLLDTA